MRRGTIRRAAVLVLTGLAICGTAVADEAANAPGGAKGKVELDVANAYLFRGATLYDGWVAQPKLEVSGLPVDIGVWGNYGIAAKGDSAGVPEREFTEIDLYASYALPTTLPAIVLSYYEYTYPSASAPADREIAVSFSADVPMAPVLSVYYGVDGSVSDNVYAEFGLSQGMKVVGDLSVGLTGTIGYLHSGASGAKDGFSHYTAGMNAGYGRFGALVTYVGQIDDDVLADAAYAESVVGMLTAKYDF